MASGSSSILVRSGTAAQSPAAKTPGTPATWRVAVHRTRPRWSSGRVVSPSIGSGRTPAVQMTVSVSNSVPSPNTTWPSSMLLTVVSRCTSMPRSRSRSTVYSPIGRLTSGMMRSVASTRTHRSSAGSIAG